MKMTLDKENAKHIETLNNEMGSVKDELSNLREDISAVKTDVEWLKKFFWIVATSSVGALATGLISLIEHR
jgi:archaellum component FlaC